MYPVETRCNIRVRMRDGIELSANLWLPQAREAAERFPAILELIPYRKDDWRYLSDQRTMTYFAQRGFVGCRVDIRGTGSSQGLALDEYTADETADGVELVAWLAAQPWCNGNVGMWGISYGGFTAIQVAMQRPPALKAIVPVYATDDRYLDDVHYIGGCLTASEVAQYAVSMVGMNAMPPHQAYAGPNWAEQWRTRLEQTPPWTITWLRQQLDGPYWRQGSLAPDYDRISAPMLLIGGWADGYPNAALRMLAKCSAPRRAIIGPWVHAMPHHAYPAPHIDAHHEMVRFFSYWLRGDENGVMEEPLLTVFRQEYTAPEAFPSSVNGAWQSETSYPVERGTGMGLILGDGILLVATEGRAEAPSLLAAPGKIPAQNEASADTPPSVPSVSSVPSAAYDTYTHRPALGTRAGLCYGAGWSPNGLARDLRPDEALSLTYTSSPLQESVDIIGNPEALLYLSSDAPLGNVVVRLTDVAPDGTSALVTTGILNLSHRESHSEPSPLVPGEIYAVRVSMRAIAYRFLPGQRIRLSVCSSYWPVIWPSPYEAVYQLHRGTSTPSQLILPVVPVGETPAPPTFKTTPPEMIEIGGGSDEPPVWRIVEDVLAQTVTVEIYGGDTTELPDGRKLMNSERIELTTHQRDPLRTRVFNEVRYRLDEHGYRTDIRASGTVRCTSELFHIDVQLVVQLNGAPFFQRSWIESIPRMLG
jgi:uncharacterized protein